MTGFWHVLATTRHGAALWIGIVLATVAFVLLFAFLHTLPGRVKQIMIVAVTFVAGLFYFLEFLLPAGALIRHPKPGSTENLLTLATAPLSDILLVIYAMAVGLGIINLVQVNGRALVRMRSGWHNSLVFFVGLVAMFVIGIAQANHPNIKTWDGLYTFVFNGIYQPLQSTTFALLAFFIASAAFRAFRVTSVESTLMMITAFIVMFGNVGSEVLTGWIPPDRWYSFVRLDAMTYWIMTTVNMSAQRALLFGIAMGELAIALRIWLSLERGHFFDREV